MALAGTLLTERLRSDLTRGWHGDLIGPENIRYDEARRVYNAMIDRRPALIARCGDVDDVVAAVTAAREDDALIAVRGGGHQAAGLGVCDDGLVIDLSAMHGVDVDPDSRRVTVEGGCTLKQLDAATHPHGLAVPGGVIGTTGVGGLALGGGLGHLTRRFGLTIDNLLEAQVVLADGAVVRAAPDENDDLFWGIRGGGGNFGIVTKFVFRAQPVKNVVAGPTMWPVEATPEVLRFWDEFIAEAPDELTGFFAFVQIPPVDPFPAELHMKKTCAVVWCYTGPPEDAEAVFAPVRAFGPPILDAVADMPFPMLQTAFDEEYPPGLQWYWKADFTSRLPEGAIDSHAYFGEILPTMHSSMHIYPIDGAASRVPEDATPWAYRGARFAQVIVGVDPNPANAPAIRAWARDYYDALHPYSDGGAYVNFLQGDESDDPVQASYGRNYKRLVKVKRRYDPDNFFRMNHNIPPH